MARITKLQKVQNQLNYSNKRAEMIEDALRKEAEKNLKLIEDLAATKKKLQTADNNVGAMFNQLSAVATIRMGATPNV